MLVFKGPTGIGKTHFCDFLIPQKFQDLITTCPSLNPDNKDAKISLANSWLVVIDEIDDFCKTKANRDNIKTYVTTSKVRLRLPYARKDTTMPRRASILATCNESRFLNDPTGSQRYIVIELNSIAPWGPMCKGAPKDFKEFDINACWAWAYQAFKLRAQAMHSHDELVENEEQNQVFTHVSEERELFDKHFEVCDRDTHMAERLTATEIKLRIEREESTKIHANPLGKVLTKLSIATAGFRVMSKGVSKYYVKKTSYHPMT
jgi:predicted P-loop ATPase